MPVVSDTTQQVENQPRPTSSRSTLNTAQWHVGGQWLPEYQRRAGSARRQ